MEKLLVTTENLAKHLDDPNWVVVDTRHELSNPDTGPRAYAEGHIPGAFFLHVDHDLSAPKTGTNGRHPLPDLKTFEAKIRACGIGPGVQVVAYDDAGGCYAVRLWWMLQWLGHEAVAVLDGGLTTWTAEGRPTNRDQPAPRRGEFTARPHLGSTVDAAFVDRFRADASIRLLDARAAERFEGRSESIDPKAGHIPGARNRFWKANLAADGRFKAPADLRAEFTQALAGTAPEASIHMCGSGVTACHNLFAMALAGLPMGRLYPGSWSEWVADPAHAVAQGPA
jgi:thiosulfate/3-mercaptopyruvate sulfurtransferase